MGDKIMMSNRSKLVKMYIQNLGCIGQEGLTIELDNIVCLVGANNSGKTTVLRAYELAVTPSSKLKPEDFNDENQPVIIELWVHIPEGVANIDEKWKEPKNGLLQVRSKWEWSKAGITAVRTTWDPEEQQYSEDGKAAGLDTVFNSRLPKPFRIGALDNPQEEYKQLLSLALEPIINKYKNVLEDEKSEINKKIKDLIQLANTPINEMENSIRQIQDKINSSYGKVFSSSKISLNISVSNISVSNIKFDPKTLLTEGSSISIEDTTKKNIRWECQGTGSQRTLFWSMLQVRTELNQALELDKKNEIIQSLKSKQEEGKKLTSKEQKQLNEFDSNEALFVEDQT